VCVECHRVIPRGADYIRIFTIEFRGDPPSVSPVHVECWALWKFVHEEVCNDEGLIMIGGLWDEILNQDSYEDEEGPDAGMSMRNVLRELFDTIRESYPAAAQ